MESTRLQKIERLLQKELSDIFQKQTQGMHGVLVSVSVVRVSPDLSVARVYLSVFPSNRRINRKSYWRLYGAIRKRSVLIWGNVFVCRFVRFLN